jgi:serine/threonine protein phosphatase 1
MSSETSDQPCRADGRAPQVPDGTRVYAVGDIHGRADLLADMTQRIAADCAAAPPVRRNVLVFVGDYVDRGADSSGVIDQLLRLRANPDYETHLLKGNHEVMFLDFLEDPAAFFQWAANGGVPTLASYDIDVDAMRDQLPAVLRDTAVSAIPDAHLELLRGLESMVVIGDYLFAHAGIRPGVSIEAQAEHDLIWIREPFLDHQGDLGKVVVHGHTPVPEPDIRSNRVNIDTLAWRNGTLTALVLEGDSRRFLQT